MIMLQKHTTEADRDFIGSNAKSKSVYRRNNMVGAGCGVLFTCMKGYYLQSHHQQEADMTDADI